MTLATVLDLFLHFASLSLLAIGGVLGTMPEMHRHLVDRRGWLTDAQFTDAIVIAQAAPGPNILFVAVLGWQVAGLPGALAALIGLLLPSSLATFWGWRFARARDGTPLIRAVRLGLSPIAIGLTAAAGWLVASNTNGTQWPLWLITAVSAVVVLRTRLNMLWLVGGGALLGALGVVG